MLTRRHLSRLTAGLATGLATAGLPSPRLARAQGPGRSLHLRRFAIMDQLGFEQPVPAASVLAPADWRLQGGVTWKAGICPTDLVSARALLSSPDGRYGFEFLPGKLWTWSLDPLVVQMVRQQAASGQGCAAAPPAGAAQALQQIVMPAVRPGSRVVATEADPAAAAALRETMAATSAARPRSQLQTDAARLRLASQGTEEWLSGAVSILTYDSISPSAATRGGMANTRNSDMSLQNVYAFRAPAGALDAAQPLLATILSSIRLNPAWQAAAAQVMMNINQVVQQGTMDRARIWRDAQAQIGEIQRRSWQVQQASQDRVAEAFSRVMRGLDPYVDPSGNRVDLTAGYGRAWSNGLGEYIVSNDPNFEPARQLNGNWSELQHGVR